MNYNGNKQLDELEVRKDNNNQKLKHVEEFEEHIHYQLQAGSEMLS